MRLDPIHLRGRSVHLQPLARHHVAGLVAAATDDRTTFGYTAVPDDLTSMSAYVASLLHDAELGSVIPFAQCADDATVIGCTRFMRLEWWAGRATPAEVEIGGTWLSRAAQRTAVNTEAKLLLLGHAFDVWGVHRVAICTDARNERSRRAIERLGATFEGVLRNHRQAMGAAVEAGRPRDTATYSIVAAEWPSIAADLRERLDGAA